MNQKTTYEITIAGKLEQLAIPDMSEMIWARIESELDADPGDVDPGNGNGEGPTPIAPSKGFILGGIGIVVAISFLINFSNNNKQEVITPAATRQVEAPAQDQAPQQSRRNDTATIRQMPRQVDKQALNDVVDDEPPVLISPTAAGPDSLSLSLAPIAIDTAAISDSTGQLSLQKDSVPGKRRGVKGITKDDYKIVPKKDTGK